MSGLSPLANQDNAYRAEVAGLQQAAEDAKKKNLEEDALNRSQKKYVEKNEAVKETPEVTPFDPDEKKEQSAQQESSQKGEKEEDESSGDKKPGKSLRGGGLLDTLAE